MGALQGDQPGLLRGGARGRREDGRRLPGLQGLSPTDARPAGTPRAWILDLDGTLVDSTRRLAASYVVAARGLGLPAPPPEELDGDVSTGALLERLGLDPPGGAAFLREWFVAFARQRPYGEPIPGAEETLRALEGEGAALAIATARLSSEVEVRDELAAVGLEGPFAAVVTSGDLGRRPRDLAGFVAKEELLAEGLARLGAAPADTGFVSDLPSELDDARRVGIGLTVGVLTGGFARSAFGEDHVVIDSIASLRSSR